MKQHRLFLKNTFYLVFGLYLTIGVFNLTVDPYGIYNLLVIEGFNDVKPQNNQQRMVKTLQLRKLRPKGIILGSSRTNYGLDPEHVAWRFDSRPVYNLSMSFISPAEIYKLLKYANSLNHLNEVIIGLDFFSYNIYQTDPISNDFLDLASVTKNGDIHISSLAKEFQNTLFSFTAIEKSFKTIFYKGSQFGSPYGLKHHNDKRSPRVLSNLFFSRLYKGLWFPKPNSKFCLYNENKESKKFEQLGKIINFSIRNNIELKIFINPIHADLLELMSFMNLWPLYENWKRGLVNLIATINKQKSKETSIRLWDFGDYNSITTEKIPLSTDLEKAMQGYFEVSHYKKSVGDIILDKVLTHPNSQKITNKDFGHLIDIQNIEKHLKNIKGKQAQYHNENRDYLEGLRILWTNSRGNTNLKSDTSYRGRAPLHLCTLS